MANHGELKIPIYKTILQNPVFTVAQLCDWTGLTRNQIYWTLADLQKKGVLTSTTFKDPNQKNQAHRPPTLYSLADDASKRKLLTAALEPFFISALEDYPGSRQAYDRARFGLDEISKRLLQSDLNKLPATQRVEQIKEILTNLRVVRRKYEIAWAKAPSLRTEIESDLARWDGYAQRLYESEAKAYQEVAAGESKQEFSALINEIWNKALSNLDDLSVLTRFIQGVYDSAKHFSVKNDLARTAAILSSKLARQDTSFRSQMEVLCGLAECALRFGESSTLPFEYVRYLYQMWGDLVTVYNFANLCMVMGNETDARDGWQLIMHQIGIGNDRQIQTGSDKFEGLRNATKSTAVYENTLVIVTKSENITTDGLGKLESEIGLNGAISIVSESLVESLESQPYFLKSTLMNWISDSQMALPAPVATSAEQHLYVYGPLEDAVKFPGVATIRVATGLTGLGINTSRAWHLAHQLHKGTSLLLVHGLSGFNRGRTIEQLPPYEDIEDVQSKKQEKSKELVAAVVGAG